MSFSVLSYAAASITLSPSKNLCLPIPNLNRRRFYSQPNSNSQLHHNFIVNVNVNVNDADSPFNGMLDINPTPSSSVFEIGKMLGSLVRNKQFHTAISLSHQMELNGIQPNFVTLNILLNCFCQLGQLNFAFSVLAKILKLGYHPNTVTVTALMKCMCVCGQIKKALDFHDDVISKGFQLNQISYGILIDGLCKKGETTAALQLLRRIELLMVEPNVVMYSTVIHSLCKDKLVSDAFHLYSEMIVKKISPNVFTFNILIGALSKEGETRKVRNVLAVMIKQGVKPDVVTYNCLIDGYFLVNEVNMAKYVFNTLAQRGVIPDVNSYNVMINGLCKKKMVDEAMTLFKEMYLKNISPDIVTYNSLIDGLCKSGGISDVWDLLDEMHDRGQPADVHSSSSITYKFFATFSTKGFNASKMGFGLAELRELQLGGKLHIKGLENVSSEYAKEAILIVLKPPTGLKGFGMKGYLGIHLPHWMRIILVFWKAWLRLYFTTAETRAFVSLKMLTLSSLPNLEKMLRTEGVEMLPQLSYLRISCVPKLALPSLPSLEIIDAGGLTYEFYLHFSEFCDENLENLKSLFIIRFIDLNVLSDDLCSLSALEELYVSCCGTLESFSMHVLQGLVLLQTLTSVSCHNLISLSEGMRDLACLCKDKLAYVAYLCKSYAGEALQERNWGRLAKDSSSS
ncbi:hypothetical protein TSUD_197100 [Trifolium subterraneum]|uniref:Uncharacterized protein n=1 Tax=Trifolium subterraneum TaxID=3900 RepID=A0A2Z6MHB9_TRISU|nr:hypothetical protein TSUD_197100 [Trifolium subterraneum]